MIKIKAFKAYRPDKEYIAHIASLPYDVVSEEEAKAIGMANPYSFLHIDKPEVFYKEDGNIEDLYKDAGRFLRRLIDEGILVQEDKPCLYIYGQECGEASQYGIVGCLSCMEYDEGKIKKHEETRKDKEEDRIRHIEGCSAHTGPIFLVCKEEEELKAFIESYKDKHKALYDFVHEGVRQVVYCIEDAKSIEKVIAGFKKMEGLYVADGHHRLAAAAAYARKRRQEKAGDEAEYENFLGVVFPKSYLNIMDYNRVIKDESGLSEIDLIRKLGEHFYVRQNEEEYKGPRSAHHIGMRYKRQWYELVLKKPELDKEDIVSRLDTSILQDLILEPIFHIKHVRTDKRIDFVGGVKGIEELNRRTDLDMDIAFLLYPPTMDELIDVADSGKLMPPKSTWFEPKLRSGLFIHAF